MKKLISIFIMIGMFLLVSCSSYFVLGYDTFHYYLELDDPDNFLLEELKDEYKAGETITVKTKVLEDGKLFLYLNDEIVSFQEMILEQSKSVDEEYLEFTFTMPNHHSKIVLKNEDNPQIFSFNRNLYGFTYNIQFKHSQTKEYYQEFIKKSGLNKLNYADVSYYDNSEYLFIWFSSENATVFVDKTIKNLVKMHKDIYDMTTDSSYMYSAVTLHNPTYYGLEEANKITIDCQLSYLLPMGIYTSSDDLDRGLDEQGNKFINSGHNQDNIIENQLKMKQLYNDEFFKEKYLIVSDALALSSGSHGAILDSVYLKDNIMYQFIKIYYASIGTCVMKYLTFTIAIDKALVENPNDFMQIMLAI